MKPLTRKTRNTIAGIGFALPWIFGFCLLSAYPILQSAYNSLTVFNLFQPPRFVGLENYSALLSDRKFIISLQNTLYITAIGTPLNMLFALGIAMLLNRNIRGLSVYRTLFYLPTVMPAVASSALWIWILNPQIGLMNNLLSLLGIPRINWTGNAAYTKPALLIMGLWSTGNMVVIFLAALKNVSHSLYEASDIDGANVLDKFVHVTLPGISPVLLFQLIISLINNLQYFTQAYLLIGQSASNNVASGGPKNSLLFYSIYLYQKAFTYFDMGTASAMAWILFFLVGGLTLLIFGFQERWVTYAQD